MKKYQIVEYAAGRDNNAGTKATADITIIAEKLGFNKVPITMNTTKEGAFSKIQRQIGYLKDWEDAYNQIEDEAIVLLQHPFHYPQITRFKTLKKLKKQKHVRYISFVHDVEKLRAFRYNNYYKKEFAQMLDLADALIVHNQVMKKYFLKYGVSENKIVDLQIFDYLQDGTLLESPKFEKSITVAGNLDTIKCGYVGELYKLKGVNVRLFGGNYDHKMDQYTNIHYYGSFPSDEIPSKLDRGFGLVWDGNSIDGCQGKSGQYLKYNNPHKLSLYLSSGLPVIIWKQAAEARFVEKNNLGILVNSLQELSNVFNMMTANDYLEYSQSVKKISFDLCKGKYGEIAIKKAISVIKN